MPNAIAVLTKLTDPTARGRVSGDKRGNPMGLRASVRTKLRPTIGSFDDGHKMGPDYPENTSKPRICLPKPAKAEGKAHQSRHKACPKRGTYR